MNDPKISACLVVYNEEKVIERCLLSIKDLVSEVVVVHDGECQDKTIEICKRFTDKIFIRPHVGMMEAHLPFVFKQASGEWLLRIDADEYFEQKDILKIKEKIRDQSVGGLIFKWELWNGERPIYFKGLQKMCLVKKAGFHYYGIPHENGTVEDRVEKIDIFLRHRPAYNNFSWESFLKKKSKWVPIHASYFFNNNFECFNTDPSRWVEYSKSVRKNIFWNITFQPLKMLMGQLKNGLFFSGYGWQVAVQQFYYYQSLYLKIWQLEKKSK